MARRLSIAEEQEIVSYMRDNLHASDRYISKLYRRSRPLIASLRKRYNVDRPPPPELAATLATEEQAPKAFDFHSEMANADAVAAEVWEQWKRGEGLPTYGRPLEL